MLKTSDILEELNLTGMVQRLETNEIAPASETELKLLRKLGAEPMHIDELCRSSGFSISTVSSTLAMMELKGMVRQVGTMSYVLAQEVREKYQVRLD